EPGQRTGCPLPRGRSGIWRRFKSIPSRSSSMRAWGFRIEALISEFNSNMPGENRSSQVEERVGLPVGAVRGPGLRQDPSNGRAVPDVRPNRVLVQVFVDRSLHGLAMQSEVEALALDLLGDPQADEDVDDLEEDQRHDRVVDEHRADADRLIVELGHVALEHAGGAAVLLDGEHAGEERADDAADGMDAECIERVIVAEHALEAGAAPVAEDAGGCANGERSERPDKA